MKIFAQLEEWLRAGPSHGVGIDHDNSLSGRPGWIVHLYHHSQIVVEVAEVGLPAGGGLESVILEALRRARLLPLAKAGAA